VALVQITANLKDKPSYDDRGLIAHNIKKHMVETGKSMTLAPVHVTIHIGYKYAHWRDAQTKPAINVETPLSVFAAFVSELEGIVYKDESQIVSLNLASFYKREDSVLVMVRET
jgi:Holliday junction resolvase RusA-like endonuclease